MLVGIATAVKPYRVGNRALAVGVGVWSTVLIAVVVYEKLGLALLRRAWFNLDLLWMIALMISGVLILLL